MIEVFEDTLVQEPLEELAERRKILSLLAIVDQNPVGGGDVFLTDLSASSTSDSKAWVEVTLDPSAVFDGRKRGSESDNVKAPQSSKYRFEAGSRCGQSVFIVRLFVRHTTTSTFSSTIPSSSCNPHSPIPIQTKPPSTNSPKRPSHASELSRPKPKMSLAPVALLVYTVGVKCRGINKKEEYTPVHMFSLFEDAGNKILKFGMMDLVRHARTHGQDLP
ncbi:hypothetical protein K443DRAFT_6975 [Laccaria amethystina LaAM-08-1]|uniref:Uncharacterized protein n=1 Tax=Laccaria amethystina LaAM-08-1 TaxID=1095629 RepID=A0A0C9X8F0_9AGAR|nr:hypothetical protein K443DRAFT_6975 [Laccaria amethystina LaAM-08-1]